ncbi:MAG: hypothetical protein ABMA64_11800 [Myxococcota bacterium]
MILWAAWLACEARAPEDEEPLSTRIDAAELELDRAVELIRSGDPQAGAAVAQAYRQFELRLEPALRGTSPPEEVLELEYAYGQLAAAPDALAAERVATSLSQRLDRLRSGSE